MEQRSIEALRCCGVDKIRLKGMRFFARHGVYGFENADGQTFEIDLTLELPLDLPASTDNVADTVDYGSVFGKVRDITEKRTYKLVEKLGGSICDELLAAYPEVMRAEVTVKKPQAPVDGDFDWLGVTVSRSRPRKNAWISLGSNLRDRARTLDRALYTLDELPGIRVERVSGFFETEPQDLAGQGRFINAAARLSTLLSPSRLLAALMDAERGEGRERSVPKGPRTLDLDILIYEGYECDTPDLTLPHPRMTERAFVLTPLLDIMPPGLFGDLTGRDIFGLLEAASGQGVRRVGRPSFRPGRREND